MEEVLNLAEQISDIIRNSQTYIDYQKAYNKIKNNAEIMEKIRKIKGEHIDFARNYSNGNYDFDREKYLSQEFYKLMLDKDIETYFMNEHKLVSIMNKVFDKISTKCVLQVFE